MYSNPNLYHLYLNVFLSDPNAPFGF